MQLVWICKEMKWCQPDSVSFDSGYVSYIITVISAWCYGCSESSEMNLCIKERINCSEQRLYQKVTSGDSR